VIGTVSPDAKAEIARNPAAYGQASGVPDPIHASVRRSQFCLERVDRSGKPSGGGLASRRTFGDPVCSLKLWWLRPCHEPSQSEKPSTFSISKPCSIYSIDKRVTQS
jgi:hypothetical protein